MFLDFLEATWIMGGTPLLILCGVTIVIGVVIVALARRKKPQSPSDEHRLAGQYLRALARHWRNTYSVLSTAVGLLTAVLTIYLPEYRAIAAILTLVFALLSLVPAGYYVWKDVVQKQPAPGKFELILGEVFFSARTWNSHFPASPMFFKICLEAVNATSDPVYLREVKVVRFDMHTGLLGDKPYPQQLLRHKVNEFSETIHLPLTVNPRSRESNLQLEIEVDLLNKNAMDFAGRLCEFQQYEIDLAYAYADLSPTPHTEVIHIANTFEEFRKSVIVPWSGDERRQYYEAAKKGGCVG